MSALGHLQTFSDVWAMSAIPLKADMDQHMRSRSCCQLFFFAMAMARFLMASASFGSSLSTWSKS